MKPNARYMIYSRLIGAVIICAGLGLLWLAAPVQAGPELPPRRPPPARSVDGVFGASIELQLLATAPAVYWTVVQWQDSNGNWHDVAGWKSRTAVNGYQSWWVHPKDFGTGPFRWSVYQGQDGSLVASSEPFTLPPEASATVLATVALP